MRPIRRVMDSPCLSASGVRFLSLPVPAEHSAFLAGDLLTHVSSHRGFRVPHEGDPVGSGALSTPGRGVRGGVKHAPVRMCPARPRHPTVAALLPHGAFQTRVHSRSPFRPSPCPMHVRWLAGILGFHPRFTPRRCRHRMGEVATELNTTHGPMGRSSHSTSRRTDWLKVIHACVG
jgi:hypothetical protein